MANLANRTVVSYKSYIGVMMAQFDREHEERIEEAVELFHKVWLDLWNTEKTGQIYKVSKTGAMHVASAPGEPPAVWHSRLKNSFAYKIVNTGTGPAAEIGIMAGSNVVYAFYLEYGTSKMRPRPIWRPATEKVQGELSRLFS